MKNFVQNLSFLRALSVCMIIFGFGINVKMCEASQAEFLEDADRGLASSSATIIVASKEEFQEDAIESADKGSASSSTSIIVSPIDVAIDVTIPKPLALNPIIIPDLNGQTFWSELISLKEDDNVRYNKLVEGQEAFIGVTDVASMFEEYNYGGINLRQALREEGVKLTLTLRNQDFEIEEFQEMPASQILLRAIDGWPTLQTSFFSLNQTIDLLRGRIHEVYDHEQQLISQLVIARETAASWKLKYKTLKKKIQQSKSVETADTEVQRLRARIAQLEKEITERDAPPLANHAVAHFKESFSLWRWFKSLFQRTSKEPNETTRLINSDTDNKV